MSWNQLQTYIWVKMVFMYGRRLEQTLIKWVLRTRGVNVKVCDYHVAFVHMDVGVGWMCKCLCQHFDVGEFGGAGKQNADTTGEEGLRRGVD